MENKNYSISLIRFISMIMIIFCHILQGLNNRWACWINVGVQIFFFVSGFLYGKKKIDNCFEFYKKRIIKIWFPYVVVLTIVLFLDIFLLKNTYSIKRIIGCYIGLGAFGNDIPILFHTWFVSYILLCYILVPILQFIFNQKKCKNSFLVFLIIIFLIQLFQIYNIINIESCWINNFIFGYYYGKIIKNKKRERTFNFFVFFSFVVIMPLAMIYQEKIQLELPKLLNSHSNVIINYGHVLLGTVLFIAFYKILEHFKIKKNKLLVLSDKYSYYIYLVHQIFILYSFSILFLTKNLFINIVLIILTSITAAIFIKFISDYLLLITSKILRTSLKRLYKDKCKTLKYVVK